MKILLIVTVIFFLNSSCITNKSRQTQRAFVQHLATLDSAAGSNLSDTISCCSSSIAFMVAHTNVRVEATPGFQGFLYFKKQELKQWHNFYDSAYARKLSGKTDSSGKSIELNILNKQNSK